MTGSARGARLPVPVAVALALVVLVAPELARAGDPGLRATVATRVGPVEAAADGAGSPEGTQRLYDLARDLQEALRRVAPVSAACRPLLRAAERHARARVAQAEGIDRLSPARAGAAARAAARAARLVARRRGACRGDGAVTAKPALPMRPSTGEVFFGPVAARAPAGARTAVLEVDGRPARLLAVRGGRVRGVVRAAPGRHDLRLLFRSGRRALGSSRAHGTWLLPAAVRVARGPRADPSLARRVEAVAAAGPPSLGLWLHSLRDGRAAGVGADLAFPAASTVKLGVLAGALARLGPAPERSPLAHDLAAVATWSSNLATNRLLRRLGPAIAADGLSRLGARASTFTGAYRVGSGRAHPLAPPLVSRRVTTARDLGRMLAALHAAAAGPPGARWRARLGAHQARIALGLLLASEQSGENVSLFAAGVPQGTPIAQKNGWLRSARHGAAIVYGARGPVVVVLLSYDGSGIPRDRAAAVGGRLARLTAR